MFNNSDEIIDRTVTISMREVAEIIAEEMHALCDSEDEVEYESEEQKEAIHNAMRMMLTAFGAGIMSRIFIHDEFTIQVEPNNNDGQKGE